MFSSTPLTRKGGGFFVVMKVSYLTGKGFLGSYLAKEFNLVHIPHDKIQETKLEPFDYFFFCSTYGNMSTHDDELETYRANIEDLLSVLRQVKGKRFKAFVYISSSSVARRVQTTYSRAKKAAEEILLSFMEKNNVPVLIIRPFSITGVGDQTEHLIPKLIRSAYLGEEMDFVPDACHDYINVKDVVSAIKSLVDNKARGIFQVGTGVQHTNQEVRGMVEKAVGMKVNIRKVEKLRDYDSGEWVSTNFKARSWGWLPKYTLEQTITEMVADMGEQYEAYTSRGV